MRREYAESSPEILRSFLLYMQTVKGKSANTVDEYFMDLRTFLRFIKREKGLVPAETEFEKIKIDDVDESLIRKITLLDAYEFLNYTLNERENNANTRARKCSSIRAFFNYLHKKMNIIDVNPMADLEMPKTKKSLPKYLTLEQSIELLNAVDGPYKERDYCILTLFLNCGMRLSELVSLNLSDIKSNDTENAITITGKGNKQRIVYLNDACVSAINDYLKVRPVDGVKDKNALFLSRLNKRISNKTVQSLVYKYLDKIGLNSAGYSVHKLRHTAATLMYQYGDVDIRVLKDILGHEDLGTTEIYTHLSSKQMEEAVSKNPLAKIKQRKRETEE
ncbi:MAG: tyrosine recombinase XerC [Acutalibacteraceae bacterium]